MSFEEQIEAIEKEQRRADLLIRQTQERMDLQWREIGDDLTKKLISLTKDTERWDMPLLLGSGHDLVFYHGKFQYCRYVGATDGVSIYRYELDNVPMNRKLALNIFKLIKNIEDNKHINVGPEGKEGHW